MSFNLSLAPLAALIAGILILVMPRLLNYIIALYLIVVGLVGLFGAGGSFHAVHFRGPSAAAAAKTSQTGEFRSNKPPAR